MQLDKMFSTKHRENRTSEHIRIFMYTSILTHMCMHTHTCAHAVTHEHPPTHTHLMKGSTTEQRAGEQASFLQAMVSMSAFLLASFLRYRRIEAVSPSVFLFLQAFGWVHHCLT